MADNATAEGRTRNRRVEIVVSGGPLEAAGLGRHPIASRSAAPRQDMSNDVVDSAPELRQPRFVVEATASAHFAWFRTRLISSR